MWEYMTTDELYHNKWQKGLHWKWKKRKAKPKYRAQDFADDYNLFPMLVPNIHNNPNNKPRPRKTKKGRGTVVPKKGRVGHPNDGYIYTAVNKKMRNKQIYSYLKTIETGTAVAKKLRNKYVRKRKSR